MLCRLSHSDLPGGQAFPALTTRRHLVTSQDVQNQTHADPPSDRFVLASASPRRSEILTNAGVAFEVIVSKVDEKPRTGESAQALVERLAREKSLEVAQRLPADPARPVLGADTLVVSGEEVLGKPRDEEHAVALLSRLVGTTHRVMTGIALSWTDGREAIARVVTSRVEMRPATRDELVAYVALGESLDKAGAYALQGEGSRFVVGVHGSRTNVIGLPQEETLELLEAAGLSREDLYR
ncbi:MAG: septum formation protein Maf [bacterium]|nr:septum formation inhibitor Maf [Deltaproteobacteria bacterium]MCP4903619.1 septum formation protein Maf [bacterium]